MKLCLAALISAVCAMGLYSCGTPSPFPLTFPNSKDADDRIAGNWKMVEDTNKHNFYEITKRAGEGDFFYHVRFFNRGGSNPTYEATIFFSSIWGTKAKFINVPYMTKAADGKGDGMGWIEHGYFFLRIIDANSDFTKITTATVNSPELPEFRRWVQLQNFMRENYDNPKIYSDTVHFYKVNQPTEKLRQPAAMR